MVSLKPISNREAPRIKGGLMMRYYFHYVPGRIRIETPVIHENQGAAEEFVKFMKTIAGITSIETQILTGSAVIHFDEKVIKREQVVEILEKHNYFHMAQAETLDQEIEKGVEKVVGVAEEVLL
jgi:copper chaperone CopZ